MFDIIFILYKEPKRRFQSKIYKVDSLHKEYMASKEYIQAHIEAAKKALTKMSHVVDGDAVIEEDFYFDYKVPLKDMDAVHVWRSKNPSEQFSLWIRGSETFTLRELTLNMNIGTADMTTSISNRFRPNGANIQRIRF